MEKEDAVKKCHLRNRKVIILDKKNRIRAIRENIPEKFRELKNQVEKSKSKEVSEEVKMAEELITICIARYGEGLERLEYASDSKVEQVYRALNNFVKALRQKEDRKSDKSREDEL